jgi:WD40 repeat protein
METPVLYSAGTDSFLKAASSTTGQVTSKLLIPTGPSGNADYPTVLHALTPQTLLLATDSSALHIYDLRSPSIFASQKPSSTHRPHDDYVSSLAPLPPTKESTSGLPKQWVTTGGTTLAVTDIRRGVLVKSEDQEEELLCSTVVHGFPIRGQSRSEGQKVVVGSGSGVLTLWERGVWDDQDERVHVFPKGKEDSVDAICVVPEMRRTVAVGCGDGSVRIVDLCGKGVLEVMPHSLPPHEYDGVVGVGFDVFGRLISGGGTVVKVWKDVGDAVAKDEEAADSSDEEDSDDDAEDDKKEAKHARESSSEEEDSSDEERRPTQKKQKKLQKGKQDGRGEHGVLGFTGLD